MANDTPGTALTLDERRLALEERAMALRERELATQDRASRTPAEAAFDLEMRQAKSLAASPFLPEKVGKNDAERVAAAWGVLRFAQMLTVDPYVVAQQIYVVHGRVGFSTSFLIGLVNERAGLRKRITWTAKGSGRDLEVTCMATDSSGQDLSVTMTMAQVEKWGWSGKSDPWKADPELMLRYRTATQLIRLYFGGAVMGLTMSSEELRDIDEPAGTVEVIPAGATNRIRRAIAEKLPTPSIVGEPDPVRQDTPSEEERREIARQEAEQARRDAADQGADDDEMP